MAKIGKKIGFGKRFLAYFIDIEVVFFVGIFIFSLLVSPTIFFVPFSAIFTVLVFLGLFVAYRLVKDSFFAGQSFGKKALRIKVVDYKTGKPCTRRQSVLRNVAFFIPFMIFVEIFMIIADKEFRRIGDQWANTVVVKK